MTIDKAAVKAELDADTRNISGLWNQAVQAYNATTGIPLAEPRFKDTKDMIKFGTEGAEQFQSWRHGDKRVDKLRSLFMQNINFIEAGAKQLVAAASASFPPAAAIGTAMTLVLSGVKGQKADYDAVVNFFEDMNNFLQRVTIIEKRVPRKKAYQNALMDVFSSLLHMCAVAHKFIALGRFKKWAINTVLGGDSELAGGRSRMDKTMKRLESATEFAILDNSENMLEKQDVLGNSLASFQQELRRNQTVQERLAQTQALALENISSGIEDLSIDLQDIKRLLQSRNEVKSPGETINEPPPSTISGNPVKALLADYISGPDAMSILSDLRRSRIPGTGQWIFDDPTWLAWIKESSAQITIQGDRGIGKTNLSVAVYEHFHHLSQEDSGRRLVAVYFQCRSKDASSNYMMAAIAAIAIQVVDQNAALRQQLFEQIQSEEALMDFYDKKDDETQMWEFLVSTVFNLFEKTSDYQLYVVVDSIDELQDEDQVNRFNDLIRTIEDRHLRVKIVTTRTSPRTFIDGPLISVSRQQCRLDLRELIRDRLYNPDSMYDGIRRLSKHAKQKLARKLEQHADGLLYAEQMLRFLGTFQRQTAIDRILDSQMPNDVAQIYDLMLEKARSRINSEYLTDMKLVISWAVFAFRPLSLNEVGQIAAIVPLKEGVAEDILSERLRSFFETNYIDGPELHAPIDSEILFEEELTIASLGDDKLQLRLRDDSMKSFFGGDTTDGILRTTVSLAHYRIFSTSIDTMHQSKAMQGPTLERYAAQYCLKHWYEIQPSGIPSDEQATTCRYFKNLVNDGDWSRSLAKLPADTSMADILGDLDDFEKAWTMWSEIAENLQLDEETLSYWRNGLDNALWPLTKFLLRNWLGASDAPLAIKAYNLARVTVKYTSRRELLDPSFDPDAESTSEDDNDTSEDTAAFMEISGLATASELPASSESHFAIGAILSSRGDHKKAISELQNSLETCVSPKDRIRCQINIAYAFRCMEDWNQIIPYCDTVLNQYTAPESAGGSNDRPGENGVVSKVAEKDAAHANVSTNLLGPSYRTWALVMKAAALDCLHRFGEAANCYRDARLCNTKIVVPADLLRELVCLWQNGHDYTAVMDTLLHSFKPIERLNLLTSPDLAYDEDIEPWDLIRLAAIKTGRQDDLVKLYKEVIKTLDAEEAGAPLRYDLAESQWALQYDVPAAKTLLNQVFDSVHDTLTYKLTEAEVVDVIIQSADLMAAFLLQEFRDCSTADDKVQVMLELKDLPNRSLPSCAVVTPSAWHGCRLALARMLQKIGPASEFQAVMNQVFEECLTNLHDTTEANDAENVFMLAKVLGMVPGLERYAELMLSAVNQDLAPREKERTVMETKIRESWTDIPCDGRCYPKVLFTPWEPPVHVCLVCACSRLCESCHRMRMEWNDGSRPNDEPNFCCDNGMYIKAPIEGWQGMENGVISIKHMPDGMSNSGGSEQVEGEVRKIEFSKLLEDVEVAWKKAWEDHWAGF